MSENEFIIIPQGISQGLYYFYGAFDINYNGSFAGYVPYFVIVNVSMVFQGKWFRRILSWVLIPQ
ncbi:hypothetical protein [Sulfuracidifex metallicus]|uniref:hypothetical protein n=1 Tax=Sulfuracidifex metallicus TaxID=47303 RepID=UPI0006CF30AB|nr:hypothetical protein [Sulfuracidifex metallicus]